MNNLSTLINKTDNTYGLIYLSVFLNFKVMFSKVFTMNGLHFRKDYT
jgi:hypothetical protein